MSCIVSNRVQVSILFSIVLFIGACVPKNKVGYSSIKGEAMGTTYSIITDADIDLKNSVDSILNHFNYSFSTYQDESQINELNNATDLYCFVNEASKFQYLLEVSQKAHTITDGFFDPTVMPLVKYWGFSKDRFEKIEADSSEIDSILQLVDFKDGVTWNFNGDNLCINKKHPNIELDVNAIAKGYGVDLISKYLDDLNFENYMVEIGGEVVVKGNSARGEKWNIAIDEPILDNKPENRKVQTIVSLQDLAMASSGNYRNFYEVDGKFYGHTINPKTGFPEVNKLLSVSVITNECILADALATGFMAMGYEKAKEVVELNDEIEAYLIYYNEENDYIDSSYSSGFHKFLP